ncbi:hypothetical protein GCM10009756_20780 [Pseudokineococcus marinus]
MHPVSPRSGRVADIAHAPLRAVTGASPAAGAAEGGRAPRATLAGPADDEVRGRARARAGGAGPRGASGAVARQRAAGATPHRGRARRRAHRAAHRPAPGGPLAEEQR